MNRKDRVSLALTILLVAAIVLGGLALCLGTPHTPVIPWWEKEAQWLPQPTGDWDEQWDAQYEYSRSRAQAWLEKNGAALERAASQARWNGERMEWQLDDEWQEVYGGHRLELALDNGETVVCYPYEVAASASQPAPQGLAKYYLSILVEEDSGGAVGFTLKSSLAYFFAPQPTSAYRRSDPEACDYARGESLGEHWRYSFFYEQ